ncbi:ATP-dependent endonuclease [Marinifilum sp. JC120]|nr:ATP-dependent endonuclease [Marinifilum sp. JC120]
MVNSRGGQVNIDFIEIRNFRRLGAVKVDFSKKTTLLVGANNSGKTSAVLALDRFLTTRGKPRFSMHDIPLDRWAAIDELGDSFQKEDDKELPFQWPDLFPSIDVWLNVEENEIHHVSHFLPALDWKPEEGIGVRLQLEPVEVDLLKKDYISAHESAKQALKGAGGELEKGFDLWPASLTDFLKKNLTKTIYFKVNAYLLDPAKQEKPACGLARPQSITNDREPLEFNPLTDLVRLDVLWPQQDPNSRSQDDISTPKLQERLSTQLDRYYKKHLDPEEAVDSTDVRILEAIYKAQEAFDRKLEEGFSSPLSELETLGYPGVTEPKITLSTQIRPTDGLHHDSAVQYEVISAKKMSSACRLPEHCNGLGYQNLISMVFHLLSFRDARLRVGKAKSTNTPSKPIHLVLLEEPEAHLHAQVQQVFIRKAHEILHPEDGQLTSQLIVSTHSSHIAHETDFVNLRYFRRQPAGKCSAIPTTTVTNLTEVFGNPNQTAKFVKRYLKATHADLFFADGVILIEGAAERMLVPHFINRHCKDLAKNYITMLEINGSHAHRLLPLIKILGIDTLIITDLDSQKDGKSAPPVRDIEMKTGNTLIRKELPNKEILDELLDLDSKYKEMVLDGFSVRVAYQVPILMDGNIEAIPTTFEDALVLDNINFFKNIDDGFGLIKKFKKAIDENKSLDTLGQELLEVLKTGSKAQFALDLLFTKNPKDLAPPAYIRDGLEWLQERLNVRQKLNNTIPVKERVEDE